MDLVSFDSLLREKWAVRTVSLVGPDEFFHDRMLAFVEETSEFMGLYLDMEQGTVTLSYVTPEAVERVVRSDALEQR